MHDQLLNKYFLFPKTINKKEDKYVIDLLYTVGVDCGVYLIIFDFTFLDYLKQ